MSGVVILRVFPPPSSSPSPLLETAYHEELPLSDLASYPLLQAVVTAWQQGCEGDRLPARLDPIKLPRTILPFVMLLDLEQPAERWPLLRIRLAGTEVCAKHGREMRGLTTDDFFRPQDAEAVVAAALDVAQKRQPSLARRHYITINDRVWTYVRLILPLSQDGTRVDSFFKVAEPEGMVELTAGSARL